MSLLGDWWRRLRHQDCKPLRHWECYQVPGPIEGEPWFEAQGSTAPRFSDGGAWLHGASAGAVLDKALEAFPDEQHVLLVSHEVEYHLCPEQRPPHTWDYLS